MSRWRREASPYYRDHVGEAQAFSEVVGGADAIVKEMFFNLPSRSLAWVLNEYGERYGLDAKAYARQTIRRWRSGSVIMSGMVAKRLFNLLPPYFAPQDKNRIVEAIWARYGPRSRRLYYVGPDTSVAELFENISSYMKSLNVVYPIPEDLRRRFDWLSGRDAATKERLLNHFMQEQLRLACRSIKLNVPTMLQKARSDLASGGSIASLSHSVSVGNHQIEVHIDRYRRGYTASNVPRRLTRAPVSLSDFGWVWWVLGTVAASSALLHFVHG